MRCQGAPGPRSLTIRCCSAASRRESLRDKQRSRHPGDKVCGGASRKSVAPLRIDLALLVRRWIGAGLQRALRSFGDRAALDFGGAPHGFEWIFANCDRLNTRVRSPVGGFQCGE